ncbi:MAG: 4-hydroxy-tetrahydrodipicolinate reductase [Xanthomonadales bacterium]|nr:4-hydroxy-tetrahydrodipicolinate reductase [Xanthomonadales bacterium]
MTNVAVIGAAGRMGKALIGLIHAAEDLALSEAIVSPDSEANGEDAGLLAGLGPIGVLCASRLTGNCDVAVEFSTPQGLEAALEACRGATVPLVSGTTGLGDRQHQALDAAAAEIPVLWAANMSLGIQLCYQLVAQASRALSGKADIEVIEAHHRHKQDSPSGTALELARIAADARNVHFPDNVVRGRSGTGLERGPDEIGVSAVRAGDIVGEHTVLFALDGERLEIRHAAHDRTVFARGALAAARYLQGKAPGRYRLADLLDRG